MDINNINVIIIALQNCRNFNNHIMVIENIVEHIRIIPLFTKILIIIVVIENLVFECFQF